MEISITRRAFELVLEATRVGERHSREHGGSLVALETAVDTVIAYAVPTGPGADQSAAHIVTDAAFQSGAIRRIRRRFPRMSYVGDWHVHPMPLPYLSATDLATARGMLLDPDLGRTHLILVLGTVESDGTPYAIGFHVTLNELGNPEWTRLPLRVLEDGSGDLVVRLGEAQLPPVDAFLDDTGDSPPTSVTHPAADRILRELDDIERRLGVSTHTVLTTDQVLAGVISRGDREIAVLFPPEYPTGAPHILVGGRGGEDPYRYPLQFGWSSLDSLPALVEEAWRLRWGRLRDRRDEPGGSLSSRIKSLFARGHEPSIDPSADMGGD